MYTVIALDIARERQREADRARLAREVRRARDQAGSPQRFGGPNPFRALAARPIRAISDASHALSEVTCTAATRIEGRAG